MTDVAPRVVSVVGARPQFVKLGPVSRALRRRDIEEVVIHTGQHYDFEMSESFFKELSLPTPDVNLEISARSPAEQVGRMVPALTEALCRLRPSLTIVFGDTSSTLAAALASAYLKIPVAHVEAGMRSFNRAMPEELNRVATDHLSTVLLTASRAADQNLLREGIGEPVFVGDVMFDVVKDVLAAMPFREDALQRFGVSPGGYLFATVHRASNTDDAAALARILRALAQSGLPVVFPLHPRTRNAIANAGLDPLLKQGDIRPAKPLLYAETLALAGAARRVLTDSGGLQKEAFYLGVPCTTLRVETEWVETVELGWNVLVGTDVAAAIATLDLPVPAVPRELPYGDGTAGGRVAEAIARYLAASGAGHP